MTDKQPKPSKVHRTERAMDNTIRKHDNPRDRLEELLGVKKGGK